MVLILRKLFFTVFLLVLACVAFAQPSASVDAQVVSEQVVADGNEYRLGAGDIIRIQVFGEPDLSMTVQLSQLGTFTYPYLGELRVVGSTVSDVQKMIAQGLDGDFLLDPKVNVIVETYREIFVGGEVSQSGSFPYQLGLTVEKAVFLAGGFTERSAKNRVKVESEDGTSSERVDLDYVLKPGDTVTIPRRFF